MNEKNETQHADSRRWQQTNPTHNKHSKHETTKKGNTNNMLPEQTRIPCNTPNTGLFIHMQHNEGNTLLRIPKYLTESIRNTNFILSNKIWQIRAPRVKLVHSKIGKRVTHATCHWLNKLRPVNRLSNIKSNILGQHGQHVASSTYQSMKIGN